MSGRRWSAGWCLRGPCVRRADPGRTGTPWTRRGERRWRCAAGSSEYRSVCPGYSPAGLLSRMPHGSLDDTREMVVEQFVAHLAALPVGGDHPRGLEDAQMLAHQRLCHLERVDEFVDTPRPLPELEDDRDAQGRRERPEQLAGRAQHLCGRHGDRGGQVSGLVDVRDRSRVHRFGSGYHCLQPPGPAGCALPPRPVSRRDPQYPRPVELTGYPGDTRPGTGSRRGRPVRHLSPPTHQGRTPDVASSASVIDTVVNLCKRRGLVYQSGEIYGGTRSAWDYGPLRVARKHNITKIGR